MNITFPPKEPCPIAWVKFADWLVRKMGQDAGPVTSIYEAPVFNVTFRQHEFSHCPFCGVKLDVRIAISERHPVI